MHATPRQHGFATTLCGHPTSIAAVHSPHARRRTAPAAPPPSTPQGALPSIGTLPTLYSATSSSPLLRPSLFKPAFAASPGTLLLGLSVLRHLSVEDPVRLCANWAQ